MFKLMGKKIIKILCNKIFLSGPMELLKDLYSCSIEILKGLTDKGQFRYLTGLKGPQEGTYLYTTKFLTLR